MRRQRDKGERGGGGEPSVCVCGGFTVPIVLVGARTSALVAVHRNDVLADGTLGLAAPRDRTAAVVLFAAGRSRCACALLLQRGRASYKKMHPQVKLPGLGQLKSNLKKEVPRFVRDYATAKLEIAPKSHARTGSATTDLRPIPTVNEILMDKEHLIETDFSDAAPVISRVGTRIVRTSSGCRCLCD